MVGTGDGAMDYIGKQSITQLNIDSILVGHFGIMLAWLL
jgi:hypothetical protein